MTLNHRDLAGIASEGPPSVEGSGDLAGTAPINDLLRAALIAADGAGVRVEGRNGRELHPSGPSDIDRVQFRPSTSTAQVRLRDPRSTEVVLDWSTGSVLLVHPRDDVRVEHVHSGEVIGQKGVVASDIVAVVLIALSLGGAAIWARRILGGRSSGAAIRGELSGWLRFNWRFHLIGGIVVAAYVILLSVTGVLLNHKRELGLMIEPVKILESESVARRTPNALAIIVDAGLRQRQSERPEVTVDNLRFVDYRPLSGYAKLRFKDEWEVIVDVYDSRIFSSSERRDVWVEQLHSGLLFGEGWTILSDAGAVMLILLSVNGIYLMALPGWRNSWPGDSTDG